MKDVQYNAQASWLTPVKLLGATGTLTVGEGNSQITASRSSAGVYVVTINEPGLRTPIVVATCEVASAAAGKTAMVKNDIAANSFTVYVVDDAHAATDADVDVLIMNFYHDTSR